MRKLTKKWFRIQHNDDFVTHEPPTKEQVAEFEENGGPGPKLTNLKLDANSAMVSQWNNAVCDILLKVLLEDDDSEESRPTNTYLRDLIVRRCSTLRGIWRLGKNRFNSEGEREDDEQTFERLTKTKEVALQRNRHRNRRSEVCTHILNEPGVTKCIYRNTGDALKH